MLISKFNKLIRNKILWSFLAFIIALFFVGASVLSRGGCNRSNDAQVSEGKLFGKKVSAYEFQQARYFELGMKPMSDSSEKASAELRERTWHRLAELRKAEKMGLSATEDDVRNAITQEKSFQSNGVFDQRRYLAFLQSQLRVTPSTFEEYLRQDLTLRRLRSAFMDATWTAPYQFNSRLANLTASINLSYAIVPETLSTNTIEISEQDTSDYYDTYKEAFKIDEQLSVRYVRFPISNFVDTVTVSTNDVKEYYDDHITDYTTTDTNGTDIVTPIDDVQEAIEKTVRIQKARFAAKDTATQLVMALAPDRYGQASDMATAAAAQDVTVMTSDWFTASQEIPGLEDGGMDLTKAAFDLVPNDPERYFSDALLGSNSVYVIAASDRRDARIPELDEVRDQVAAATRIKAAEDAYQTNVDQLYTQLVAAVSESNTDFLASAKDLGLMTATTGVFTVYEGLPSDTPGSRELLPEVIDARQGEVLDPVRITDGTLIATVVSRTPGAPSAADMLRPQFTQTMDQYRASAVYEEWQKAIMAEAKFKDYHPIRVTD